MNLIEQEVSTHRWIDIPDEIVQKLFLWRPSPLMRAVGLEKAIGTTTRIYYKNEGGSPAGSHKLSTAIPQAYYNKIFGIERLVTETGVGQWGSALAMSCRLFGLACRVYMVRISFDQKPFRKLTMQVWGAERLPSPSANTKVGKEVLAKDPNTPGSLGIAISEAIEDCVSSQNTRDSLGSVLNNMHQTVIGLEAQKQFKKINRYPDVVIGCAGGGKNLRIVAVEPTACPSLTRGPYVYDHGDLARMTPLLPMYSLGQTFIPKPIHAGGLRYHGMAPMVSHAQQEGLIESVAIAQIECYKAAMLWARTEGFIPAPETSHAIAQAIREAKRAKEEGKERSILFNWFGHGLMDLTGYDAYLTGKLSDYELPDEDLQESLAALSHLPKPPPLK